MEDSILTPPEKRSLADEIGDRLREAILRGQFAPGQRLREEHLAARLEVSRGPVREALTLLERENLVVVRRNRGATVAHLTREDLDEVYSLRLAVEQLAVRQAVERATEVDFELMQSVIVEFQNALDGPISEQDAAELDLRYHDALYSAAHHRRLGGVWSSLRSQVQVFLLRRNIANPDWREMMVSGHQAILDSIRARDSEEAESQITSHLAAAYDRIRESFADRAR
ncbi:MAG TPA: GntR family transcriptional regulator [Candidatus Dormibacteraeota bacterium]|jgi:DNA-binding GntR family transcriptional regulator|nr:GntR family transcriptional regulator [Candidatus Dormibacteraeota bacterium]